MMNNPIFTGAATALVTPFKDNQVDYRQLGELIERQLEAGIKALVIAGTTGEASAMPDKEHIELIAEAVKMVAGRVPVIAGTGSNDTAHGINLSRDAKLVGADALLHVTPYYNKTNQAGLVAHFKAIAQSVDLPIVLYNVPSRTGLNINPETYLNLADQANIVAIKECNIAQMPETLSLVADRFTHYSGEDGLVVPLLSLGGAGVISVVSNLVPAEMSQLVQSWFDGNISRAAAEQVHLMPLIKACFLDVNPISVKAALTMMGYDVGEPRLPLIPLDAKLSEILESVLLNYRLITQEV